MSADVVTITEFLEKRIAEDEAQAEHAVEYGDAGGLFTPARVLAECAAKRAILATHHDRDGDCEQCSDYAWFAVLDGPMDHEEFPCPTIRAFAAVYADHPDYQREWTP